MRPDNRPVAQVADEVGSTANHDQSLAKLAAGASNLVELAVSSGVEFTFP